MPVEKVKFELGNSDLPFGPVASGSNTTATVGSAIYAAAQAAPQKARRSSPSPTLQSPLISRDAVASLAVFYAWPFQRAG